MNLRKRKSRCGRNELLIESQHLLSEEGCERIPFGDDSKAEILPFPSLIKADQIQDVPHTAFSPQTDDTVEGFEEAFLPIKRLKRQHSDSGISSIKSSSSALSSSELSHKEDDLTVEEDPSENLEVFLPQSGGDGCSGHSETQPTSQLFSDKDATSNSPTEDLSPSKMIGEKQINKTLSSSALLQISLKTADLAKRNKQLQCEITSLQQETRNFVISVLSNPENRTFLKDLQSNSHIYELLVPGSQCIMGPSLIGESSVGASLHSSNESSEVYNSTLSDSSVFLDSPFSENSFLADE